MSNTSQKDAVYNTVVDVFNQNNIQFSTGSTDARQLLDKNLRKQIIDSLITQFENDEIALSSRQKDIREYVSGLLSNWLRKDLRLNGNVRHQIKNPGSRKGQQDPLIKNLRILQSTLEPQSEAYVAAQQRIDARLLEIKKSQAPKIDITALPPEFHQYIENQ